MVTSPMLKLEIRDESIETTPQKDRVYWFGLWGNLVTASNLGFSRLPGHLCPYRIVPMRWFDTT
jgi:hypothetical protein